jgi:hypothetical protein
MLTQLGDIAHLFYLYTGVCRWFAGGLKNVGIARLRRTK